MFQHTAPRRWLRLNMDRADKSTDVSTHSHPKVAAALVVSSSYLLLVSTHSHPKVAASKNSKWVFNKDVSTHSHPKVAALF